MSGPHSPVPHPASSTSRLFDASTSESASISATSAGARYDSLASLASKLAAKLSKVFSTNASDARAGTSRPEHAASMCRAMGWSGSSSSHSSKTVDRLVDFAERAVRQRQQSSRFGVLRPERDDLAEADGRFVRPLLAVQQDAEVGVRVRVVGVDANGGSIGRFRFDRLALRPQDDAEIVVRVGMIRIERNRALERGDRLVQLEAIPQDDPEIAVPVRPIGLELETSLDQRDGLLAPRLLMGEHSREVHRVGMVGRDFEDAAVDVAPPPPTARSAAAGSRSRALRPG